MTPNYAPSPIPTAFSAIAARFNRAPGRADANWAGSSWSSGTAILALLLALWSFLPGAATAAASLDYLIKQVATEEGLDPTLLQAVIATESAFNPNAISPKGAVGLMQLMPGTASDMGVSNRFNPEDNLRGGARYLKQMLEQFASLRLALAAYNAGPGAVTKYGGVPPYPETQQYVTSVLSRYSGGWSNDTSYRFGNSSRSWASAKAKTPVNKTYGNKKIYVYRDANGTLVITDVNPKFKRQLAPKITSWKTGGTGAYQVANNTSSMKIVKVIR